MLYTYQFWCSEVVAFHEIFGRKGRPESVYLSALNAITYLASNTLRQVPEHREEVLQQFDDCYTLAQDSQGEDWLQEHIEIIASHGALSPT